MSFFIPALVKKTLLVKLTKNSGLFYFKHEMFPGIYNEDGPYVAYIDVKKVAALSVCQTAPTLELGGGMNLHDVIHTLETLAEKDKNYFYGKAIGAHLRKVLN